MARKQHSRSQSKVIVLPDESRLYTIDKATIAIEGLEAPKFLLPELILALLYAQEKPLYGRTSMMKQIFLMVNEIVGKEYVEHPRFIPHKFGPYSYLVTNTLNNLEFTGMINRQGRRNARMERFSLTGRGSKEAREAFRDLPGNVQEELRDRRKGWDQLGREGILKFVYSRYPKFIERSVLKRRYKPIVWGRGVS